MNLKKIVSLPDFDEVSDAEAEVAEGPDSVLDHEIKKSISTNI